MDTRIVTIFRSRLNSGIEADYGLVAARMNELATQMPGYQASHDAWRNHPEHRTAQRAGRERFYSEYSLTVAEVRHHREFPAG